MFFAVFSLAPVSFAADLSLVTFPPLARAYVQHNRDAFLTDRLLTTAYTNRFFCTEYMKEHNNEFNMPKLLDRARDSIRALHEPDAPVTIRTMATFGTYDADKKQFTFAPIDSQHNIFIIGDPEQPPPGHVAPCAPTSAGWPQRFSIIVENYDVIDGIPMSPEQAKLLLDVRAKKAPDEQRRVGLNFTVALKEWGKADSTGTVPVTAQILSAMLDSGADALPKPIYTYPDAYFAAHEPAIDKRIEAEHIEHTTGPIFFNAQNVSLWLQALVNNGPKTMPDGTALRHMAMSVQYAMPSPADNTPGVVVNALAQGMVINMPTSTGQIEIGFTNNDEFQGVIPLSEDDYKKLAAGPLAHAYIVMSPVGGRATPAALFVHVDKLVFEIPGQNGQTVKIEVPAKSAPPAK